MEGSHVSSINVSEWKNKLRDEGMSAGLDMLNFLKNFLRESH